MGGMDQPELGIRIRDLREALGLEQQQLARAAGVSKQHMSDIEHGKSQPSLQVTRQLARALGAAVWRAITTDERPS